MMSVLATKGESMAAPVVVPLRIVVCPAFTAALEAKYGRAEPPQGWGGGGGEVVVVVGGGVVVVVVGPGGAVVVVVDDVDVVVGTGVGPAAPSAPLAEPELPATTCCGEKMMVDVRTNALFGCCRPEIQST